MLKKIRSLIWYLKRPLLYPQLLFSIKRKFSTDSTECINSENTKKIAMDWCESIAMDSADANTKITGQEYQGSIKSIFSKVFAEAEFKADLCPIKMGGAANIDLLYWLAEYFKAMRVVETGVAYGWSSLAILLSLNKRPGAKLISIDMPYVCLENDEYVGCVVLNQFQKNWKLFRMADRQGIPKALKFFESIDMCHYDSDKTYQGRMWAYPILWDALVAGGLFISDDVGDNTAFRDFAVSLNIEPVIVKFKGKFTGVLVKS